MSHRLGTHAIVVGGSMTGLKALTVPCEKPLLSRALECMGQPIRAAN